MFHSRVSAKLELLVELTKESFLRGFVQQIKALVPGVVVDVVIPYSSDGEPDWHRLANEVKVLDDSGAHALSIGGVLGGTIGATPVELSTLCAAVKRCSKKPLFAMLFPDASPEAFEMVRAVEGGGADAILVAQPHYLAQPGAEGLEEMFAELRAFTNRPLLIADCLPGSMIGLEPIQRLIQRRLVDGVLEAADMHVLVDLLCLHQGVPVYSGVEDLHYPALVIGAHGFVSNLASVFPRECVELYAAFQDGDHSKARKLHERLLRLWRTLSCGTEREARLRSALAARGRPVGAAGSPYGKLPPEANQQISSALKKEGIPLAGR